MGAEVAKNAVPFIGPFLDGGGFFGKPNRPEISQVSPYTMPDYQSIAGPDGKLLDNYSLHGGADLAMDPNIASNPWVQMMQQVNKIQTGNQLDSAAKQNNAGTKSAWSGLAARGGLSSGARERVARAGANDLMTTRQGVQNQGNLNSLGILTQGTDKQLGLDAQNRQYKTGIDEVNLQSLLADKQLKGQYDMNKYNTQMQAWAANNQATATEHSGKKG